MENKLNPMDAKFKKDKLNFTLITNAALVCADCMMQYDDTDMPCNTSKCAIYPRKPNEVLSGGECNEYVGK